MIEISHKEIFLVFMSVPQDLVEYCPARLRQWGERVYFSSEAFPATNEEGRVKNALTIVSV